MAGSRLLSVLMRDGKEFDSVAIDCTARGTGTGAIPVPAAQALAGRRP